MTHRTGKNIRNIQILADINRYECLSKSITKKLEYTPVPNDCKWKISMVRELTDIRYDVKELRELSMNDIEEIINYICTT